MNVGHPGCPVTIFDGVHGQPRPCTAEPTHTAVVRWKQRRCWVRVFPCSAHAVDVTGAEPITDQHRELLAERRAQVRRALAGLPYVETPTSADPGRV